METLKVSGYELCKSSLKHKVSLNMIATIVTLLPIPLSGEEVNI